MLIEDLIQITNDIYIIMSNKKECNNIGFNFSMDIPDDLMEDLKKLKVIDIYSDCGVCVEVDFNINFYNKYINYFY